MTTVGPVQAFSVTIASAVTYSSAVDLGGSHGNIMIGIPTMTSATDIFPLVSDSASGTFRQVYNETVAATTTPTAVNYDSSVTNCYVPLNCSARYIKLGYTSATTEASQTFKFLCGAN